MNFKTLFARIVAPFNRLSGIVLWALLSLVVLLLIATVFNPAKFSSYLWVLSKLSLAAVLGYGFDLAVSGNDKPESLEGIERAMAQTRRATLMAASIIAAGLMP